MAPLPHLCTPTIEVCFGGACHMPGAPGVLGVWGDQTWTRRAQLETGASGRSSWCNCPPQESRPAPEPLGFGPVLCPDVASCTAAKLPACSAPHGRAVLSLTQWHPLRGHVPGGPREGGQPSGAAQAEAKAGPEKTAEPADEGPNAGDGPDSPPPLEKELHLGRSKADSHREVPGFQERAKGTCRSPWAHWGRQPRTLSPLAKGAGGWGRRAQEQVKPQPEENLGPDPRRRLPEGGTSLGLGVWGRGSGKGRRVRGEAGPRGWALSGPATVAGLPRDVGVSNPLPKGAGAYQCPPRRPGAGRAGDRKSVV